MKFEQYKSGAVITVHSGGPRGPKGEVGPKGDTGEKGPQGIQGPKGKDGYTPVKGVDYFDGEKGDKGEQGDPGFYNLQSIMEDEKGKTLSDFVDLLKFLGVNTNYELLTIENYQNLTTIDPNKTYFIKEEQI